VTADEANANDPEQARFFLLDERSPFHLILGLRAEWMREMVVEPIERGDKAATFRMAPMGEEYVGLAIAVLLQAVRVLLGVRQGEK
jgi:hypothetical protein